MAEVIIRPVTAVSGRVTPASFPFYTTGEDNLRLTSWNAAAGVSLKMNGRTLDAAGKASPQSWDHTPNTDRSAKTSDFSLSGTTLLNITIFCNSGAPLIGQTFVRLQLIRGFGTAALVLGTILQGYVTATQAIGFPGSPIQTSIDSGGYLRTVTGTTPAPGADISESVPAGARWQLLGVRAVFQASAAVATRTSSLSLSPNLPGIMQSVQVTTIPASQGAVYNWQLGFPLATQVQPGFNVACLPPDVVLLAAGGFFTSTQNIQAGDQWSQLTYAVREWLEP